MKIYLVLHQALLFIIASAKTLIDINPWDLQTRLNSRLHHKKKEKYPLENVIACIHYMIFINFLISTQNELEVSIFAHVCNKYFSFNELITFLLF